MVVNVRFLAVSLLFLLAAVVVAMGQRGMVVRMGVPVGAVLPLADAEDTAPMVMGHVIVIVGMCERWMRVGRGVALPLGPLCAWRRLDSRRCIPLFQQSLLSPLSPLSHLVHLGAPVGGRRDRLRTHRLIGFEWCRLHIVPLLSLLLWCNGTVHPQTLCAQRRRLRCTLERPCRSRTRTLAIAPAEPGLCDGQCGSQERTHRWTEVDSTAIEIVNFSAAMDRGGR